MKLKFPFLEQFTSGLEIIILINNTANSIAKQDTIIPFGRCFCFYFYFFFCFNFFVYFLNGFQLLAIFIFQYFFRLLWFSDFSVLSPEIPSRTCSLTVEQLQKLLFQYKNDLYSITETLIIIFLATNHAR